ncbi:MAG: pilin [Patescibacteria group bacterium]|jgi:hypothetical protein
MKRLFLIGAFLLLTFPQYVFAASILDCTPNTFSCICYKTDASAEPVTIAATDMSDLYDDCRAACTQIDAGKNLIRSFAVQCIADGAAQSVIYGMVGDNVDPIEDALTPRLSVEIPGFDPELSDSFFGDGKNIESNLLGRYVEAVYQWLLAAGSLCAVVLLMVGGLQWVIAAGDVGKVGKAKDRIVKAIFGLALLFGCYTLAFLIDPSTVAFDSLVIQVIDRKEMISESGDTGGSLSLDTSNVPESFKCSADYSLLEIAEAAVGNVCYRFGGGHQPGQPPFSAETYLAPDGTPYSTFCPEGKLCLDCSAYVAYLQDCKGLEGVDGAQGTTAIFSDSRAEKITSCDELSVNGVALVPGDLIGWKSVKDPADSTKTLLWGHVLMYLGDGKTSDSAGGKKGRACQAVSVDDLTDFCDYDTDGYDKYVIRQ